MEIGQIRAMWRSRQHPAGSAEAAGWCKCCVARQALLRSTADGWCA